MKSVQIRENTDQKNSASGVKDKSKQTESTFSQNLISDLICGKLKEIVNFQDIIKTNYLSCKRGVERNVKFW